MKQLSQITVVSVQPKTTETLHWFVGTLYHDPIAQRSGVYSRVSPYFNSMQHAENFLMLWIVDYEALENLEYILW